MKDNFSTQAKLYAQFRPSYPKALYDFLFQLIEEKKCGWDCATGNGQIAIELATKFERVYATDISEKQISNAQLKDNIIYKIESAEESSFPDLSFDLITIGQAIHWFDFEKFYAEVNRTLKPKGVIAVIGYPLMQIDKDIDAVIDYFYTDVVGSYWDTERNYLDEHYKTIPFPFKEIKAPTFFAEYDWEFDQLIGFLNTWSAVQHYINKNGSNPVGLSQSKLKKAWGDDEKKKISFEILLRVGVKE
ncbi:MAG: class I SAM-dependent methyltransferase [Bacteroidia bacterium]